MEERIGHYRIVSELGRGGMGVVYKAHEESLNRFVALKVLGEHLAEDPAAVQRFVREAQSAARLNHPNIVQIYAISEEDGRPFFAMEFVSGTSLQRLLRSRGQLEIGEACRLTFQAASGLAAAHDLGVIHRDIKPANLMIDERGLLKIADFGLALLADSVSRLTATGMFMGTPGYLSPEQCLDRNIDHRTDIYSLGITFFETLTGVMPFKADSPLALLRQILEVEPPDIASLRPEVDETLRGVLTRMIVKDRDQRYPDCHALLGDLEGWLDAHPQSGRSIAALVAATTGGGRGAAALTSAGTEAAQLETSPTVQAPSTGGRSAGPPPPPQAAAAIPPPPVPDPIQAAAAAPPTPDEAPITAEPAAAGPPPKPSHRRDVAVLVVVLVVALLGAVAVAGLAWKTGWLNRLRGGASASSQPAATTESAAASDRGAQTAVGGPGSNPEAAGTSSSAPGQTADGGQPQAESTSISGTDGSRMAASTSQDATTDSAGGTAAAAGRRSESSSQVPTPEPSRRTGASSGAAARSQETAASRPAPQPTGVVVVAVGEPLLAGEAAAQLEAAFRADGVKLVDENAIPAAAAMLGGGAEPPTDRLVAALERHARILVVVRAEYLGSRQLRYLGRADEAFQSRLTITPINLAGGESPDSGWNDRIEYTHATVAKKVDDALRPLKRRLALRFAGR